MMPLAASRSLQRVRDSPGSDERQAASGILCFEDAMRGAHLRCFSGCSGDMILAALIDAGADAEAIRQGIASLGLPITVEVEKIRKGGFGATQVRIEAPEQDTHRFLPEVEEILGRGSLTPRQRELA